MTCELASVRSWPFSAINRIQRNGSYVPISDYYYSKSNDCYLEETIQYSSANLRSALLRRSTQAGIDMVFYIALVVKNVFVCQELACE